MTNTHRTCEVLQAKRAGLGLAIIWGCPAEGASRDLPFGQYSMPINSREYYDVNARIDRNTVQCMAIFVSFTDQPTKPHGEGMSLYLDLLVLHAPYSFPFPPPALHIGQLPTIPFPRERLDLFNKDRRTHYPSSTRPAISGPSLRVTSLLFYLRAIWVDGAICGCVVQIFMRVFDASKGANVVSSTSMEESRHPRRD